MRILENKNRKYIISKNYHYVYDKETDISYRCGKNIEESIYFSPLPETVELEISNVGFLYNKENDLFIKLNYGNINQNEYLRFTKFRRIFHKIPMIQRVIQQLF